MTSNCFTFCLQLSRSCGSLPVPFLMILVTVTKVLFIGWFYILWIISSFIILQTIFSLMILQEKCSGWSSAYHLPQLIRVKLRHAAGCQSNSGLNGNGCVHELVANSQIFAHLKALLISKLRTLTSHVHNTTAKGRKTWCQVVEVYAAMDNAGIMSLQSDIIKYHSNIIICILSTPLFMSSIPNSQTVDGMSPAPKNAPPPFIEWFNQWLTLSNAILCENHEPSETSIVVLQAAVVSENKDCEPCDYWVCSRLLLLLTPLSQWFWTIYCPMWTSPHHLKQRETWTCAVLIMEKRITVFCSWKNAHMLNLRTFPTFYLLDEHLSCIHGTMCRPISIRIAWATKSCSFHVIWMNDAYSIVFAVFGPAANPAAYRSRYQYWTRSQPVGPGHGLAPNPAVSPGAGPGSGFWTGNSKSWPLSAKWVLWGAWLQFSNAATHTKPACDVMTFTLMLRMTGFGQYSKNALYKLRSQTHVRCVKKVICQGGPTGAKKCGTDMATKVEPKSKKPNGAWVGSKTKEIQLLVWHCPPGVCLC